MKDINKEFRFYRTKSKTGEENTYKPDIVPSKPKLTIDNNGNLTQDENHTYCLATKTSYHNGFLETSNSYFGIKYLGNDHYIVIDIHSKQSSDDTESILYNRKFELKFGIIKITREHNKSIVNKGEKIIAPIVYDRIYVYDDLYPIMEVNGKYTYFCLDQNNPNYGKQLVPAILEAACPFNIKYPGFAECTIQGEQRFLPINFIAAEAITKDDLLTEDEIIYLINSYEKFNKLQRTTKSAIPQLVGRLYKHQN